ncbi:MAG: peptide chain release factor N(5)-glutamine methyltransferase [Kiritimatiellae bacterium]|nr:peptide chain release factor N(5)-glutamine methyltransferase [Kiritimatiellia bacterium]
MVWREVIDKAAEYLDSRNVPDACTAGELLAARLLSSNRGELFNFLDKEPTSRQLEAMRRGMARLVKNEPIQYILGEWDFRRLTLKCDSRALIPRPETEGLVSLVLDHLRRSYAGQKPFVVDVGTGTGAIILSIASEYKGEGVFLGTDISEDAVSLARENAALCGLEERASFVVMDGLDDFDEPQSVDIIVSNPPYIESDVCETLDPRVKDFEPRLALDGGTNGLDFYDRYLADALNLLKSGGSVFFEMGDTQGEALEHLMQGYGFSDIKILKDLSGRDRYAVAMLP